MQNFRVLGAPPPDPHASGGWDIFPHTPIGRRRPGAPPPHPQNSPPLRISGYAPGNTTNTYCRTSGQMLCSLPSPLASCDINE